MSQTKQGAIKLSANHYGFTVEQYLDKIKTENYCNKCKQWKTKKLFCIDNSRATGLHKNCNDCRWVNGGKRGNFIKDRISPMKGKKHKGIALKNIQKAVIKSNKERTGKTKKYTNEGYKRLINAITKPRPSMNGKNNHQWRGGVSSERQKIYYSIEHKQWRKNVFERDRYICQDCGDKKGGNLEAHHIKEFAKYPKLRHELSNGITLCNVCHEKRHFNPNSTRNIKRKNKNKPLKF